MLDDKVIDSRIIPYIEEIKLYRSFVPTITDGDLLNPSILVNKISRFANDYFQKSGKWEVIEIKYLHSICYQINDCLMADYTIPVNLEDVRDMVSKRYGPFPKPRIV